MALRLLSWFRCLSLAALLTPATRSATPADGGGGSQSPRLLVLTDIGQDPDDQQSLVRLLLYANEFDLEGLIATADNNSEKEAPVIRDDIIHEAIRRYGEVLGNLRLHDWRFPDTADLVRITKAGNPWGGNSVSVEQTIGADRDTDGSNWIITQVDRADRRPLNIAIWGGASDLAQALWRVRETRSAEELNTFLDRLRVFGLDDQDATNQWIREQFPQLFYIRARAPVGDRFQSGYRGIFLGGDYRTLSREWLMENIKHDRGPLVDFYPERAWTQENPHYAIKEGDTPSFFYFLPNGLHEPGQPGFGGWGGRYTPKATYWEDSMDTVDGVTSYRAAVWRWREHFQHDFSARADWCVKSYADANHHPIAIVSGDSTRNVIYLRASAGEMIRLSAEGSTDPDGDRITSRWWVYPEASSLASAKNIPPTPGAQVALTMPAGNPGETVHLILEVNDDGHPALVSYRRVVVTLRAADERAADRP